jgi:CheY-like chemotaxis protein
MDFQSRLDVFEPGDQTALVCIDVPEVQRIVVDQLNSLNYKIHTGLFLEDILLKLRAHAYDVVIISEHFNGGDMNSNGIVTAAIDAPPMQRRKQFIVAIGSSLVTNDELQAFQYSVDLVVGIADVVNLRPVLRRGVARMQEFFGPFREALKAEGFV